MLRLQAIFFAIGLIYLIIRVTGSIIKQLRA